MAAALTAWPHTTVRHIFSGAPNIRSWCREGVTLSFPTHHAPLWVLIMFVSRPGATEVRFRIRRTPTCLGRRRDIRVEADHFLGAGDGLAGHGGRLVLHLTRALRQQAERATDILPRTHTHTHTNIHLIILGRRGVFNLAFKPGICALKAPLVTSAWHVTHHCCRVDEVVWPRAPTMANWARFLIRTSYDFSKWQTWWTLPLAGGFHLGAPVSTSTAVRHFSICSLPAKSLSFALGNTNTCINPPLHGQQEVLMNPKKIPDCFPTHDNFGYGGCPYRPLGLHTQVSLNVPTNKNLVDSNQGSSGAGMGQPITAAMAFHTNMIQPSGHTLYGSWQTVNPQLQEELKCEPGDSDDGLASHTNSQPCITPDSSPQPVETRKPAHNQLCHRGQFPLRRLSRSRRGVSFGTNISSPALRSDEMRAPTRGLRGTNSRSHSHRIRMPDQARLHMGQSCYAGFTMPPRARPDSPTRLSVRSFPPPKLVHCVQYPGSFHPKVLNGFRKIVEWPQTEGYKIEITRRKKRQTLNIDEAAVAERLDCSPPTKANWVQSPAGSLPDFHKWELSRMMLLAGGFSRGSNLSPALAFWRCSIFTSVHPRRLSRPCYESLKSLTSIKH
ncbi:hypothetical protein PR048_005743 [Dryococelus australis]|uniref:Uncharacterized protein n=1 Tax=Dryococelus australis TaxID=614101 RepID=A0ABQ9I911_9NEOP|nr:hypothetical protein PR048_005743 [Dryococelus australis]